MEINWFFLALLSPALWAIVVLIDDNLLRGVYKSPSVGTVVMGIFSLLPLLGLLFFPISVPSILIIFLSLISGFLLVISVWFYFKSLNIETPSVVLALWNLTYVIVPVIAYFFLGEFLRPLQYLGFALVLFASFLISLPKLKNLKIHKAFSLMFLSSVLYAISSVLQKYVYNSTDFWSGYVFITIGTSIAGLLFIVFSPKGRQFLKDYTKKYKKYTWIFILSETIYIIAVLFNNLAISKGPVSLVKVIEGVEPIYILLFALIFYPFAPKYFREAVAGNKLKKLILMGIMLIGLYIIYL
jgi:drug/metabolite transporter (DMT)-like permease